LKNYTCVSGYHRERGFTGIDTFFKIWMENLCKLTPEPEQLIIIADSGARPPMGELFAAPPFDVTIVPIRGDLGNCHALLNGIKPHKFAGWSGVVLAGAMLAYCNETDMVFYEEDVIHKGDVIGKMYEEIGDAGIIFGSTDGMPSAQSLFLIKHDYLPEFVRLFLSQESQQMKENLGENIFARLQQERPSEWKRFSFGYDRTRPFNLDDEVLYLQHITADEMGSLKEKGII
jgi:hypothetical protein